MTNQLPSWSASATESIGLLYRQLQPIEIYVEDSNSEAFYFELLNRMLSEKHKIKKIIPLHGREHVIKYCESHSKAEPALFLIDGDLELFNSTRVTGLTNLFQLKAYCIENYLFCKNAAIELLVESSGTILRENSLNELEWASHIELSLIELKALFEVFAAAKLAAPEVKTVSHGISSLITQKKKKSAPAIDPEKIKHLKEKVISECIASTGHAQWEACLEKVIENSKDLKPIDGISGKDFLIPILKLFLQSKGVSISNTSSMMFKLAKYCSLGRLDELKNRIEQVINGQNFISS